MLHIRRGRRYNENGFDADWIKSFRRRVRSTEHFANVTTIAADLCCGAEYNILKDMAKDAELAAAVDVVGTHCPGPLNGQAAPPVGAHDLKKPLWDTEQHFGLPDPSPAECFDWAAFVGLAQVINQNFVVAQHTATWMWTAV